MKVNHQYGQYNSGVKFFHWLMGLLWLSVWVLGFLAVRFRENVNPHHELTFVHKSIASFLLVLLVLRILWRLRSGRPAMDTTISPAMQKLAHYGHIILYAVTFVGLLLSGWMWSSVAGKEILILGLIPLFPLTQPYPEYYDLAKLAHMIFAYLSIVIVIGHILMAFKHHFFDKDNTLLSMLPNWMK
jgi:cytochrome b561